MSSLLLENSLKSFSVLVSVYQFQENRWLNLVQPFSWPGVELFHVDIKIIGVDCGRPCCSGFPNSFLSGLNQENWVAIPNSVGIQEGGGHTTADSTEHFEQGYHLEHQCFTKHQFPSLVDHFSAGCGSWFVRSTQNREQRSSYITPWTMLWEPALIHVLGRLNIFMTIRVNSIILSIRSRNRLRSHSSEKIMSCQPIGISVSYFHARPISCLPVIW